jgi:dipeptidyl aminopeptidase/acylaminoacyl peptidase
MEALAGLFPNDAVKLIDSTADRQKLAISIAGGTVSPSYFLFDRKTSALARLSQQYKNLSDADINPVTPIEYRARDGRTIPSVLTYPRGKKLGDKLPLIVMPHGGPTSYDAVGFDWMAQYFASRGYLVFQPNFRGSDGFGREHRVAGYGEWGGKMQDDITDGAELLIRKGWADPNRTCIIGGSYGGYAALAGGAYTPDLYKCVAAIAPVTDLNFMLSETKREEGSDSADYTWWTKLIGNQKDDRKKIDAISPVKAAANFKAPVLLIHGNDDTIVPFEHSSRMESALKKAGKPVTLIKLQGGDHWLSKSDVRLQTLRELDKFVEATIGSTQ